MIAKDDFVIHRSKVVLFYESKNGKPNLYLNLVTDLPPLQIDDIIVIEFKWFDEIDDYYKNLYKEAIPFQVTGRTIHHHWKNYRIYLRLLGENIEKELLKASKEIEEELKNIYKLSYSKRIDILKDHLEIADSIQNGKREWKEMMIKIIQSL